ncbi:hypothetical protein V6N13_064569 [Hibiscus sabdariffa]
MLVDLRFYLCYLAGVDDAPEGPPAITIEFMYQTMTSRFDNMDAFLRTSHEESTAMIRRLDDHLTSLEKEMRVVRGHLLPPTLQSVAEDD